MKNLLFILLLFPFLSYSQKIIIDKENRIVKYVVPDSIQITLTKKSIHFQNLVVCDLNESNAEIIQINSNSLPEDWINYSYADSFMLINKYRLFKRKRDLKNEAIDIFSKISQLINTYDNLLSNVRPAKLNNFILLLKQIRQTTFSEINALQTLEDANDYVIDPRLEKYYEQLKEYLE